VSLLDAVVSFARDLRAAGMGVSVSEVADAVQAAGEVGALGREAFRAALESTLVKEPAHRPIFRYLFDVHFPIRRALPGRNAGRPTSQMLSDALRSGETGQMQEVVARLLDVVRDGDERSQVVPLVGEPATSAVQDTVGDQERGADRGAGEVVCGADFRGRAGADRCSHDALSGAAAPGSGGLGRHPQRLRRRHAQGGRAVPE